jgi:ABC-2 type transport system ATP-binding protein
VKSLNKTFNKSQELAIEVKSLVKEFGKNRAVDGVNLTIPKGTVYGFLGPNGAGKTTTVRMLATLLHQMAAVQVYLVMIL